MISPTAKFAAFATLVPAITDIRWRPGIGDPTVMGWVTVAAYLVVWWLCCRASLAGARIREAKSLGEHKLYWLVLAVVFFALAINKQLNLQSLFTEIARDAVRAMDLYESRRALQAIFMVSVLCIGTACLALLFWITRRSPRHYFLANVGLVYILIFIVVRGTSFHRVDQLLRVAVLGVKMNWFFELSGIACVGIAARVAMGRAKAYKCKPPDGPNSSPADNP
jgi:hypothetical protein